MISIFFSLVSGNAFLIFNFIFFFDLKNGPKSPPISEPKLEASLIPNILKISNKIIIIKN